MWIHVATLGISLTLPDNLSAVVLVFKQDNAVEYCNSEKQHKLR